MIVFLNIFFIDYSNLNFRVPETDFIFATTVKSDCDDCNSVKVVTLRSFSDTAIVTSEQFCAMTETTN